MRAKPKNIRSRASLQLLQNKMIHCLVGTRILLFVAYHIITASRISRLLQNVLERGREEEVYVQGRI